MGRNWVLTVDFRSFVSVVFVEGETKCGDDDDQMGCVDWMVQAKQASRSINSGRQTKSKLSLKLNLDRAGRRKLDVSFSTTFYTTTPPLDIFSTHPHLLFTKDNSWRVEGFLSGVGPIFGWGRKNSESLSFLGEEKRASGGKAFWLFLFYGNMADEAEPKKRGRPGRAAAVTKEVKAAVPKAEKRKAPAKADGEGGGSPAKRGRGRPKGKKGKGKAKKASTGGGRGRGRPAKKAPAEEEKDQSSGADEPGSD
ncbi:hypothetical protein Fcan01_13988 [Folsomia candida]|uniref:Uncharacterized protein n=2 Tax=Folsomia candida TaxID=158441 RepID=A0A226DZ45_FOLCA|nr:hypothetical protein Fcan01_13988 [Folsomia candida]